MQQDSSPSRFKTSVGLLALAAAAYAAFQVGAFVSSKSLTIDETFYLNCTLQSVHDARIDPRMAESGVAPLGAIAASAPVVMARGGRDVSQAWGSLPEHAGLNRIARMCSAAAVLAGLALAVSLIVGRRSGPLVGVCAGALLLTSPTFLAHGSLAATDGPFALMSLLALLGIAQFRRQPGLIWGAVAAIALATAFSTKYSGVYLGLVLAIGLCIDRFRLGETAGQRIAGIGGALAQSLGIGLFVFVVAWGMHGFQRLAMPKRTLEQTPTVLQPAPIRGVVYQAMHNQRGHNAYLMGEFSLTGWWHYYPVTLLIKSTPAELLLMLAAVASVMGGLFNRRFAAGIASGDRDLVLQTLAIGAVVLLGLALRSRICIGQRYLLPLYPTAIVLGCCWLATRWPRHCGWVLTLLLLSQTASSAWIAPHQLAYFSPVIGGAHSGANYLIDSNLDWGQDLPALERALKQLGKKRLAYQYFGSASPEFYGVRGTTLAEISAEKLSEYDALAVSQTFLQGGYSFGRDPFRQLRQCKPLGSAGYSIVLYDLKDRTVREATEYALQAGVPVPTKQ